MRGVRGIGIAIGLMALACGAAQAQDPPAGRVGAARLDITPDGPIRLTGYGSRKTESEGIEQRLYARALAIASPATGPAVLVAVENLGVPAAVTEEVARRLKARAGIPRERLAIGATHTHTGPALAGTAPFIFGAPLPPDQQERIERYTKQLTDKLEAVALAALADLKPGRLGWTRGAAGFAANRRVLKDGKWTGFGVNPEGPTDRSLPLLRASGEGDTLRAVVVGYACHCTTLEGNFNKICGDWAGYAAEAIERAHPDAVALIVIGCGADANPEPRGTLDRAKAHGATVAREAERLLGGAPRPVSATITARFRSIDLPFADPPPRAEWAKRAEGTGSVAWHACTMLDRLDRGEALPRSVAYPVQTWSFGDDLAMAFLGGEVVVDYALRLGRELDGGRLWTIAYSNDVPCYIASKRLLPEGGYEVDASMVYYGRPGRLAPEAEDRIVDAVRDLLPASFRAPAR